MPNAFEDRELASKAGKSHGQQAKTKQWLELHESIVTTHAKRFNQVLTDLPDDEFAKLFKDILNYFKPKINYNINETKEQTTVIYQDVSGKLIE